MTKICSRCKKKILKNEKGVTWITFEGERELEVVHWHFKCFLEWKNESLENRAQKIYMDTIKKVMPQFEDIVSGVRTDAEKKQVESFL